MHLQAFENHRTYRKYNRNKSPEIQRHIKIVEEPFFFDQSFSIAIHHLIPWI